MLGGGLPAAAEYPPRAPAALQLPAPRGGGAGPPVRQRAGDTLAHGHHLGRGQPAADVPAKHEGPAGGARLVLGLLHQPQRHRLPDQVRAGAPTPPEPREGVLAEGGACSTPALPQASFWSLDPSRGLGEALAKGDVGIASNKRLGSRQRPGPGVHGQRARGGCPPPQSTIQGQGTWPGQLSGRQGAAEGEDRGCWGGECGLSLSQSPSTHYLCPIPSLGPTRSWWLSCPRTETRTSSSHTAGTTPGEGSHHSPSPTWLHEPSPD